MLKRKPGLSRDEHKQLGAELATMRDRLVGIAVQLNNAYSGALGLGELASGAQSDLDKLRSKLENVLFDEHPGLGNQEGINVYFPNPR